MRKLNLLLALALIFGVIFFLSVEKSFAQCAMCSFNAENSVKNGNTQGMGLNDGILFLLAMPFLALAGIGLLWYKKYRKSSTQEVIPFKN